LTKQSYFETKATKGGTGLRRGPLSPLRTELTAIDLLSSNAATFRQLGNSSALMFHQRELPAQQEGSAFHGFLNRGGQQGTSKTEERCVGCVVCDSFKPCSALGFAKFLIKVENVFKEPAWFFINVTLCNLENYLRSYFSLLELL
jgi:hypothetical protein